MIGDNILKYITLCFGVLSLISYLYLFVLGEQDYGVGVVGQYKPYGLSQQTVTYPSPEFFALSLRPTIAQNPKLRRLQFKCPDASHEFTIFITSWAVFNIPSKSVTCDDGFKLLEYNSQKGFTIGVGK